MTPAEFWTELFKRRDKGPFEVEHKSGRRYVVLGLALEVSDAGEESWTVVYHPEGQPNVLFHQSPHRFAQHVERDGQLVPRFKLAESS